MPNDSEQLIVRLEARIAEFEKNMLKAERSGTRSFQRLRKESATATGNMERDMQNSTASMANVLAGFSSKIGAMGRVAGPIGVAVAAFVASTREAAGAIAEVGDQAKIAGVGFEAFQELKYVAEQNRIGIDSLTDGLKELNLRADEFIVTGKGSAAEAFQRLGYTAEDLKTKLKEPSALFAEIIGRLGQLDRAAQIRIADEIFGGTGGEKFVKLIDQGRDGINATIKEARDLSLVMDEQLLAKAERLDSLFKTVATTVGVYLKSAIVSAADSLAEFIDGFRDFQNQRSTTLHNSQSDIMAKKAEIGEQIRRLKTEGLDDYGQDYVDAAMAPLKAQLDDLNAVEDKIIAELQNRSPFNPMNRTADRQWTAPATPTTPTTPTTRSSSSARDKAAEEAGKEAKAVDDLIAKLQLEQQQVRMTDVERAKSNALRDAGAAATAEQRAQIESIIMATYREREVLEATRAALADLKSDTGSFITTFRQGMMNGEGAARSFATAVGNMANSIATRLEQLFADKLVTWLFGSLLGAPTGGLGGVLGLAAGAGTFPAAPSPASVAAPSPVPAAAAAAPAQAAGASRSQVVQVDARVYVDDNGNWQGKVEQISGGVAVRAVKAGFDRYRNGVVQEDIESFYRNPRRR